MADKVKTYVEDEQKEAFSIEETVSALVKALRYYADPDNIYNCTDDVEVSETGDGMPVKGPGLRAREVLGKYGLTTEAIMPSSLSIKVAEIEVKGELKHRGDVHTFVDGVEQHGVQSIRFEASVDSLPLFHLERTLWPPVKVATELFVPINSEEGAK